MVNYGDNISSQPIIRRPYFKNPLENDDDPTDENCAEAGEGSVKNAHFTVFGAINDNKELAKELHKAKDTHDGGMMEHVKNSFLVISSGACDISSKVIIFPVVYPFRNLPLSLRTQPIFMHVIFKYRISPFP